MCQGGVGPKFCGPVPASGKGRVRFTGLGLQIDGGAKELAGSSPQMGDLKHRTCGPRPVEGWLGVGIAGVGPQGLGVW